MRKFAAGAIASLILAAAAVANPVQAQAQPVSAAVSGSMSPAAAKYKFKNCKALNKVYRHGVGKAHAKDKTSGKPVTNFERSTKLYKKIVGYRSGLDRDKDGIACEKH